MNLRGKSTIRLAIRTLPENFDRSRIAVVLETIKQELFERGVYASASDGSTTIEITVPTDKLLDTAKVLNELALV